MKLKWPSLTLGNTRGFFIGFLTTIGAIVFFSFTAGIIIGALTDKRTPPLPKDIVLSLDLNGTFVEKPGVPSLANPFPKSTATLHTITRTLNRAARDKRVHGLYIRLNSGNYGLAHIQEFRDAIDHFQESGKFVYVFSTNFGGFGSSMGEYYIAASADEIWMQPVGTLSLTGYSLQMPFFRGLLDKIGIEPEVISKGRYKSTPETLSRHSSSPASKEMSQAMLTSLFEQFIRDISRDRELKPEIVKALIDQSPMMDLEALKSDLIDSLGYWDEFIEHVQDSAPENAESISLSRYARSLKKYSKQTPKFAFIQAAGAISSLAEGAVPLDTESAFSEDIWDAFQDAAENPNIQAIIFRVDSPGGTPTAAETIRRAVQRAKKQKPVIVSMGNMAASGGYWVSTQANAIVAQPATLTGSIGVFAIKPNLSQLWEKLNINWETLNRGDNADLWSTNKALNPKERQQLQSLIDHTYDQFIERVAMGRQLSPDQIENLAQGRVWTGEQALKNGLIDALGGLDMAIIKGKELVDISPEHPIALVPYPKPLSPIEQIIKLANDGFITIPSFLSIAAKIDYFLTNLKTKEFQIFLH